MTFLWPSLLRCLWRENRNNEFLFKISPPWETKLLETPPKIIIIALCYSVRNECMAVSVPTTMRHGKYFFSANEICHSGFFFQQKSTVALYERVGVGSIRSLASEWRISSSSFYLLSKVGTSLPPHYSAYLGRNWGIFEREMPAALFFITTAKIHMWPLSYT